MKRLAPSVLILAVLLLSAFRSASNVSRDVLAALGLSAEEAEAHVFQSVWGTYLSHPTGERLRAVAVGDRPAVAREAVAFARSYVASPAFAAEYARMREAARPAPPEPTRSANDQLAEMKAQMRVQIDSMEAQAKRASGDMKAIFEEAVQAAKEQLAELEKPDNFFTDASVQAAIDAGAEKTRARYEAQVAEWEATYPEDPSRRVTGRIREMLDACSDVDFSAELRDGRGGHRVFVSTAYEEKPPLWKLCYRAGPEVVAAARAEAERWLADLR